MEWCIGFQRLSQQITTNWVGLKQQKLIFSQPWRPGVQNQGIDRAVLPLRSLGKNVSLSIPSFLLLPAIFGTHWLMTA